MSNFPCQNFIPCSYYGSKLALSWPAEMVWLLWFWSNQFFLKVKVKFHFYKNQVINKSASMIGGLIRLIIYIKLWEIEKAYQQVQDYCCSHIMLRRYFVLQKLSNKQSGRVIFRLDRFIKPYSIADRKSISAVMVLSTTH